ncbi:type II secretion system protein [Anabaena aphanizomenioides LEGE 00250]|uniref:Type II secretion system protein n=1 Tax=Sphaerospermopsis aphanizomenoides LEGE 00250 TaxID=2777972 RepID=A0ABR9VBA0_9CYAN|nr:type II secretion system protein [Sphaerospermopsis aphanizomenoides]MBE9235758.1 type II secretion system protein [Sphaerospermopsis aphanizomenoides LEGE 00250]
MRHYNVSDNQGFTILEALIVAVFAGILVAMAGPSYFAWSQRRAVDSAITSIQGAIKEAQRQAMARSQPCTLTFNSTTITSSPANCLITGDRILNNVTVTASATSFDFDNLGNTTSEITVVVAPAANPSSNNKCLVLSKPLGLIRIHWC